MTREIKMIADVQNETAHYLADDFRDPLVLVDMVESILQDLVPDYSDDLLEAIADHPLVKEAFEECCLEVEEYVQDTIEWAKGPMAYYGLKQADFI